METVWEHVLSSFDLSSFDLSSFDLSSLDTADRRAGHPAARRPPVGGRQTRRASAVLPLTVRLLLVEEGVGRTEALLAAHDSTTAPCLGRGAEGRRLARWLGDRLAGFEHLAEALAMDVAALDLAETGRAEPLELPIDPLALLAALHRGCPPRDLPRGRYVLTIGPEPALPARSGRRRRARSPEARSSFLPPGAAATG